jgi:uncharacterized protein (TIGR03067 family)
MNDVKLAHPSLDRLMAFGQGRLAEADLVELSAHLGNCADCRAKVEEAGDDTLISLLRAADTDLDPVEIQNPQEAATMAPLSPTGDYPVSQNPGLPPELADHARYRVQELLGVGGMGSVYKAEHLLMERPVALKLVSQSLTSNPAMVARFRREVKTAGQLKHSNIVMAYDAEQAGDLHFLVMEYVEGKSLARLVSERGPLPVDQACDYIRQAALGLQYAHERGMVHRDIKPHNLMLTPDGQVKILDFGLARFAMEAAPAGALLASPPADEAAGSSGRKSGTEFLTQVGTVMGTPDYIAPEQAADAHTADIRADIYSLGCTLYDLLAGHAPFPEGTVIAKVTAHAKQMAKLLTEIRKDVPPELALVIERMMAKDPAKRYQTPAEVAEAVQPFISKPEEKPRRSVRRWLIAASLAAAVVLTGTIIHVQTDKGEFIIETDDENVAVLISQNGVRIRDESSGREYLLKVGKKDVRTGEYEIVSELPEGIVIEGGKTFTVKRGRKVFATAKFRASADHQVTGRTDQDLLQGTWKGILGMQRGRRVNDEEVKQATVKFIGNTIHVSVPWENIGKGTFELDARRTPKRIAVTYGEPGKRKTSRGVYTLDGDILRLCIGAPEEGAIEDIGTDAGIDITLRRETTALSDMDLFQGTWRAIHVEAEGVPAIPDEVLKRESATLSITGNTVLWQVVPSIPNAQLQFNGIFHLDPTKQPKTVDFFYLDKDARALLGIYRLENDKLTLCWSVAPKKPEDRPTEFSTKGKNWTLVVWQRVPDVKREPASLSDQEKIQGLWKAVSANIKGPEFMESIFKAIGPSITFTGKKVNWKANPSPEANDAFGGTLAKFSLEGLFSLDSTKSPKTIDFTVLGKDPKTPLGTPAPRAILGIYKLEGDSLEICAAIDPEHAEERPTKFESIPHKFIIHVTLKRSVANVPAPQGKLINSFGPGFKTITRDGIKEDQGGWRIEAKEARVVRLHEVQPPVEDCLVTYRAKLKSTNLLAGKAYLVMWARMPYGGEFFSKGLMSNVSGSSDWKSVETSFILQKDERTDLFKLNLHIEGAGTVWIKDVELWQTPLPAEMKRPTNLNRAMTKEDGLMELRWSTALNEKMKVEGLSRDHNALRIDAREQRTWSGLQSCAPVKAALPAEGTLFTYRAKMKANNLQGKAYLEIWCQFSDGPNKGEYSHRNLEIPLSGTTEWASYEVSLPPHLFAQTPDQFKLNLVIEGSGTVWIKDIELLRGPAPSGPGERVGMDLLQGVWLAESMEINGKPASTKELASTRFTFMKDKTLIRDSKSEGKDQEATHLMADFTQSPWLLDITIKNKTLHGIFEVNGDVLKVCYETGNNSENRPTKFSTSKEKESVLIVFKKQKP